MATAELTELTKLTELTESKALPTLSTLLKSGSSDDESTDLVFSPEDDNSNMIAGLIEKNVHWPNYLNLFLKATTKQMKVSSVKSFITHAQSDSAETVKILRKNAILVWQHFSKKSRQHKIEKIDKLGQEMMADPEKFVDKHNLRSKIPAESLPCVVNIKANGDVTYYNRLRDALGPGHITLTFPLKEGYTIASFRHGRRIIQSQVFFTEEDSQSIQSSKRIQE